ncbi:hypothetical protein MBLNU457_g0882t1 [Dothideomycetes sp. NU457]
MSPVEQGRVNHRLNGGGSGGDGLNVEGSVVMASSSEAAGSMASRSEAEERRRTAKPATCQHNSITKAARRRPAEEARRVRKASQECTACEEGQARRHRSSKAKSVEVSGLASSQVSSNVACEMLADVDGGRRKKTHPSLARLCMAEPFTETWAADAMPSAEKQPQSPQSHKGPPMPCHRRTSQRRPKTMLRRRYPMTADVDERQRTKTGSEALALGHDIGHSS